MTEQMINVATVIAGGLILLLVYFVWLAAQRRKNWPRWALAAALVLSVISLVQVIGENGVQFDSGIEVISCALTAAGLYFSFTGDAHGLVQRVAISSVIPGRVRRIADLRCAIAHRECPDSGFDAVASPRNDGATRTLRLSAKSCNLLPWNGPTKASCWGCGGMANPPPSSSC